MADEVTTQGGNETPAAPPMDLAASLAANLNTAGVTSTQSDTSQGQQMTPAATPASPSPVQSQAQPAVVAGNTPPAAPLDFRGQLRTLGVDLSGLPDDNAALQQVAMIYQQLPQVRQLAAIGEQVYPYLSQFRGWLQEQQQRAQQQTQQQPAPWFKAPEYDPAWITKLTRDPATGQLVPVAGAPPDIVQKFTAFAEHRQQFIDKLAQDPIAALRPGLEQLVQTMVAPLIQQSMQQQVEARKAEQLVQQHADWLHEKDANGVAVRDQFGNKVLSVWGQRYAGYAQQAQQLGIYGTENAHSYALGMVERDFAVAQIRAQQQAQAGVQQGQQAKNDFVNAARHQPNVGSQHALGTNGAPAKPSAPQLNNTVDLANLLRQRMQAAGYGPNKAPEYR